MANSTPHLQPWLIDKDTTNGNSEHGVDARYALGGLLHPAGGTALGHAGGVMPNQWNSTNGILDYRVSQQATANMTVLVQAGQSTITRSTGRGPYIATSNQTFSVTITAANATLPRIDYVVMRTSDLAYDLTAGAVTTLQPVVLAGTPAASPTEPSGLLTERDILLAAVTVRAATTQILDSDISDRRVYNAARGGIYPKSTVDTRGGSYPGQYRDNMTNGALERWTGTAWVQVATAAVWNQFTGSLQYRGNLGSGGSTGPGTVNLGAGSSAICRWILTGKKLELSYTFIWGSSPFGGAGRIYASLPPGFLSRTAAETHIHCHLTVIDAITASYLGNCQIPSNSSDMNIEMPGSFSDCSMGWYVIAGTVGVAGSGRPIVSGGYPQGGTLTCTGTVEVQ